MKKYRILDNKTNELAEWDFNILDAALAEAFGEGMHDTFLQRYEFAKEYDYLKGKWKK